MCVLLCGGTLKIPAKALNYYFSLWRDYAVTYYKHVIIMISWQSASHMPHAPLHHRHRHPTINPNSAAANRQCDQFLMLIIRRLCCVCHPEHWFTGGWAVHEEREGRKSSGVGIWRGGKMERERGGRRRRKKELSQIARRERARETRFTSLSPLCRSPKNEDKTVVRVAENPLKAFFRYSAPVHYVLQALENQLETNLLSQANRLYARACIKFRQSSSYMAVC